MEQLLDNGQLKFEQVWLLELQILDLSLLLQVRDAVATASGMASEVCKEEEILQGIGQLVDAHFIERAPPCNLPDEKVAVHPNAQAWCYVEHADKDAYDMQPKRGRAAPKPNTPEEARLNEERARAITNKRYRDDRYSLSTQQLHGSGLPAPLLMLLHQAAPDLKGLYPAVYHSVVDIQISSLQNWLSWHTQLIPLLSRPPLRYKIFIGTSAYGLDSPNSMIYLSLGTDGAADEKPKPPYPETNGNPAGRGSSAGAKRKRNTGEEAAELMASSVVPSGLWRISQNEFTRQFSRGALNVHHSQGLQSHMHDPTGGKSFLALTILVLSAGLVVKGLLAAGRPAWTENAASEATSPPATQTSIAAAVRDLPGGKHLDVAAVRQILQIAVACPFATGSLHAARATVQSLQQRVIAGRAMRRELRSGMAGCVLTTPEGSFYLHLARTVELMQEAEVHAHLLSRFGHEGASSPDLQAVPAWLPRCGRDDSAARGSHAPGLRIWNMLRLRGQLEESAIAESALMAPKEARTMLYQLLSSGFVSLQVRCRCLAACASQQQSCA
ncbi:hypothetical protein MMC29_003006 [Sticta canariensis]|nr:hypothetical protein [Sticta canariensis]